MALHFETQQVYKNNIVITSDLHLVAATQLNGWAEYHEHGAKSLPQKTGLYALLDDLFLPRPDAGYLSILNGDVEDLQIITRNVKQASALALRKYMQVFENSKVNKTEVQKILGNHSEKKFWDAEAYKTLLQTGLLVEADGLLLKHQASGLNILARHGDHHKKLEIPVPARFQGIADEANHQFTKYDQLFGIEYQPWFIDLASNFLLQGQLKLFNSNENPSDFAQVHLTTGGHTHTAALLEATQKHKAHINTGMHNQPVRQFMGLDIPGPIANRPSTLTFGVVTPDEVSLRVLEVEKYERGSLFSNKHHVIKALPVAEIINNFRQ